MFKILINIVVFATLGTVLALLSINSSFSTGAIGAVFLIVWGLVFQRHWSALEESNGDAPCPSEQALSIQLCAYCLLLSHLITSLLHTNIDLHVGSGNTLAIDSWIMVLAAISTEILFRQGRKIRDERDAQYFANAVLRGYQALVFLVVMLSFYLAFTPPSFRESFSNFLIGNILIALILMSYSIHLAVRLHRYANDRQQLSSIAGDI